MGIRTRTALVAAGAVTAAAFQLAPAASAGPGSAGTVGYRGLTLHVPTSWPVYDLTRDPTRCVRFDEHAVYLGHPGTDQRCPARAVGHTTAVLLEPYDAAARAHVADPAPDSGQVQARSADGRVLVTASYGTDGPAGARRALAGAALSRSAPTPERPAAPPAAAPGTAALGHGSGFDTCGAPSEQVMAAWGRYSPNRYVGIYVGGVNRACGDGNLSAAWVSSVRASGFSFIPTYVGRQAPCSGIGLGISTSPTYASQEGATAGSDAVLAMRRFGLPLGAPVYLDMEAYTGDATCHRSVALFLNAWIHQLHVLGYLAGIYTSSSSFGDVAAHHNQPGYLNPDAIWLGRWNDQPSVYGDPSVSDRFWTPHRRIHQYRGPHDATYGGFTINVDTDYLDGPVG